MAVFSETRIPRDETYRGFAYIGPVGRGVLRIVANLPVNFTASDLVHIKPFGRNDEAPRVDFDDNSIRLVREYSFS